jgi:hypothetical protein
MWMSFKVNMSRASQLEVRQTLLQRQQVAASADSASAST